MARAPVGERSLDLGSRDAIAVGRIVGNGVECVAGRQVRGRRGCRWWHGRHGRRRGRWRDGRRGRRGIWRNRRNRIWERWRPCRRRWQACRERLGGARDQLQRGTGQRPCNRSTEIGMILRRVVSRRQVRPRPARDVDSAMARSRGQRAARSGSDNRPDRSRATRRHRPDLPQRSSRRRPPTASRWLSWGTSPPRSMRPRK